MCRSTSSPARRRRRSTGRKSRVQLPTTPGQLEATEATVENIIKKLDKVPFQEIGDDLTKAINQLDQTLVARARHARERARYAGEHQQSYRAKLRAGPADRQYAAGGEPRGAIGARARRLSRAPSRGAPPRQDGEAK